MISYSTKAGIVATAISGALAIVGATASGVILHTAKH